MPRIIPYRCLVVLLIVSVTMPSVNGYQSSDIEFFEKEIRPILDEHCFKCHGPDKQKAELRLDHRESAIKGGESGAVIKPGDSKASRLLAILKYDDETVKMPPKGRLKDAEIALIAKWIDRGAVMPETKASTEKVKAFDLDERRKHWAYQPLAKLTPFKSIDGYIFKELRAKNLNFSLEAEPLVWLRRVTFDLTGLPPTIEEQQAFTRERNFEKVVDRLLGSKAYAERWARHWLDLVRYAETQGHEFDFPLANAWQYRDYLIRAFQANVPYDQMLTEHLAGDLMPKPRRDAKTGRNESILGTGFFWLGEAKHSPVDIKLEEAHRIDNQIDVIGKAFLAQTISCARCHDHKFDAISANDYYALYGILKSTRYQQIEINSDTKTRRINAELFQGWTLTGSAFEGERVEGLIHSGLHGIDRWGVARSPTIVIANDYLHMKIAGKRSRVRLIIDNFQLIQDPIYGGLAKSVDSDDAKWLRFDIRRWKGHECYIEVIDGAIFEHNRKTPMESGWFALEHVDFNDSQKPPMIEQSLGDKQKVKTSEHKTSQLSFAPVAGDGDGRDESIFIRGVPTTKGAIAPRGLPVAMGGPVSPQRGSGRLELAKTLTSPSHPLTARVMVNRLWHHHFGQGLVRTVDDFGVMGEPPSHPELLDFLAKTFVDQKYDIKAMHRMMVLSHTYRQRSNEVPSAKVIDPNNRLLHRMNIRRLEAEVIRDSLLSLSGKLKPCEGGPPVPTHLTEHMTGRGRPEKSGPIDGEGKRSIYQAVNRNFLSPFLLAFDYPVPMTTIGRRTVSNVPAQSLAMMNDLLVNECSSDLANRVEQSHKDQGVQISLVYQAVFGRPIRYPEQVEMRTFLEKNSFADLTHALICSKEFIFVP